MDYGKKKLLSALLLLASLAACVSEYTPSGIEELSDMLVVDGIIEEGETTITLRRTIGLLSEFDGKDVVTNAHVTVESNTGYRSAAGEYTLSGQYVISDIVFEEGAQYRVNIRIEEREYVSQFLTPLSTPPVAIDAVKAGAGEPVYICVTTADESDESPYYLWKYEENWEVWARIFARLVYQWINGDPVLHMYDLTSSNNIYYCWGRDADNSFLLESTEKYSSNQVVNKKIIQIEPTDDKLSVLYHVKVRQYQIRKAAYDFYYNLQKNVDSGGSIFGSMPMEMKGNIINPDDPEEVVIGYVEVTTAMEQEKYYAREDGLYESPTVYCRTTTEEGLGYMLVDIEDGVSYYAPRRCADCRTSDKATKNKPDFWPTDKL